jgi:hypothetical protein
MIDSVEYATPRLDVIVNNDFPLQGIRLYIYVRRVIVEYDSYTGPAGTTR